MSKEEQSQEENIKVLYDTADKFINLANELNQKDPSGTVGSALRFAAARFSAFESSLYTKDLEAEKEAVKEALLKDYALMVESNLDVYIAHLKEQKQNQTPQE